MIVAERPAEQETPTLSLREGPFLRCPKCETRREEWDYPRLRQVEKYADQTVAVYICPARVTGDDGRPKACGYKFALPPRGS
jgi:hypothetical protein